MNNKVLELENDILNNNLNIVSILRKAHLIAIRFHLLDFDKWIQKELNGYSTDDAIPNYRTIEGKLMAKNPVRGWIPVIISNKEICDNLCKRTITNSVSELIKLGNMKNGDLIIQLPLDVQKMLNESFETYSFYECAVFMPKAAIGDIEEKVKNTLLEWCAKIESDDSISIIEKSERELDDKRKPLQNSGINVVAGNNSTIVIPAVYGGENNISIANNSIEAIVKELKKSIDEEESICPNDKAKALKLLSRIEKNTKPSRIKSLLSGLRDYLISVGAGVTVAYIDAKIKGII